MVVQNTMKPSVDLRPTRLTCTTGRRLGSPLLVQVFSPQPQGCERTPAQRTMAPVGRAKTRGRSAWRAPEGKEWRSSHPPCARLRSPPTAAKAASSTSRAPTIMHATPRAIPDTGRTLRPAVHGRRSVGSHAVRRHSPSARHKPTAANKENE